MKLIRYTGIAGPVMVMLTFFLTACGTSAPYRYYTLAPVAGGDDGSSIVAGVDSVVFGVGPVTIPDYLDRPQVVTRTTDNEMKFSEYDRWAGSLAADTSRVLEERLDKMLSDDGIAVVSWQRGVPNDYRVAVQITRFEVADGKDVILKAQWVIYAGNGKRVILLRESDIRERVSNLGTDSAVESMGRALSALSRDIVQGFRFVRFAEVEQRRVEELDVLIEEAGPIH